MPQFECSGHHAKCKALCCQAVPIEKEIFYRNALAIVREIKNKIEFEGTDFLTEQRVELFLPLTEDGYCPFLTPELKCNIYEDRPKVCRLYGNEERKCLRCPFQDKDGNTRSRQQTRKILRDATKEAEKLIKIKGIKK